jgi:hypothetical protein
MEFHEPLLWIEGAESVDEPVAGATFALPKPKLEDESSLVCDCTVPLLCELAFDEAPGWLFHARPAMAAKATVAPAVASRRVTRSWLRTASKREALGSFMPGS